MDKYKKFKCNICDHSDDSKAHLDVHIDAVHLGVRYNCDLCDKSYRYEHHVRKHKAAVHEKLRPFVCNLCGKTYSDNTPLRVHMEVAHSKKGNFPCPECGRVFSHNVKMKSHYSHTHGGGQPNKEKVKCDTCSKDIEQYKLKSHLRSHVNLEMKTFQCQLCSAVCSDKQKLKRHMDVHKSKKIFQCQKCDKKYKAQKYVYLHNKYKHGEADKMYKCNICDKAYVQPGSLYIHKKTHIGGEYECLACKKIFDTENKLKKHLPKHSEGYEECTICHQKLRAWSMKMHMRYHNGEKPFVCNICGKPCSDSGNLRVHIKSHTAKEKRKGFEQCVICSKKIHKIHMERHMQAHNAEKSFKCVVCGRASTDNRFLKHHMPTHFLDEMECVICSMKLVLRLMKSHMQYHNGERMSLCKHCGQGFFRKCELSEHIKKFHIHTINDDAVYKQCDICLKRVSFRNVDFHMKTKHLEY